MIEDKNPLAKNKKFGVDENNLFVWILVIIAIAFPSVLYWADRTGFGVILKPIFLGLSIPFSLAAGLSTVFALGEFVAAPASGFLTRKFGVVYALILGIGIFSLFTVIEGISTNATEIFGARILTGVGEALFYPVALSLAGMLALKYRGTSIGIVNVLQGIGVFSGSIIYASLYVITSDWRYVLIIAGIIGFVVCFVSFVLLRFPRIIHDRILKLDELSKKNKLESNEVLPLKEKIGSRDGFFGIIIMGLLGFIQWPWLVLIATYLEDNGFSVLAAGTIAGIIGVGFILAAFGGFLGDKVDRRFLLVIGSSGEIIATFLMFGYKFGFYQDLLIAAFFGTCTSALVFTNTLAIVQNSVPKRRDIPFISGYAMGAYYGTGFVSGFVVGKLVTLTGWLDAMAIVVVFPSVVCVALAIFLNPKRINKGALQTS